MVSQFEVFFLGSNAIRTLAANFQQQKPTGCCTFGSSGGIPIVPKGESIVVVMVDVSLALVNDDFTNFSQCFLILAYCKFSCHQLLLPLILDTQHPSHCHHHLLMADLHLHQIPV